MGRGLAAVVGAVSAVVVSGRSWGAAVTLSALGVGYVVVVGVLWRSAVVAARAARGLHPRR